MDSLVSEVASSIAARLPAAEGSIKATQCGRKLRHGVGDTAARRRIQTDTGMELCSQRKQASKQKSKKRVYILIARVLVRPHRDGGPRAERGAHRVARAPAACAVDRGMAVAVLGHGESLFALRRRALAAEQQRLQLPTCAAGGGMGWWGEGGRGRLLGEPGGRLSQDRCFI